MWCANEHSDDENVRWSWLRAVEWINWPIFVSQPVIPILFYFYPMSWDKLVLGLIVLNIGWHLGVPKKFASAALADAGCLFARLKWISCPAAAYLLWTNNLPYHAIGSLLWPMAVLFIQLITNILLNPMFKTAHIGPVQNRFMLSLGYTRARIAATLAMNAVYDAARENAKPAAYAAIAEVISRDGSVVPAETVARTVFETATLTCDELIERRSSKVSPYEGFDNTARNAASAGMMVLVDAQRAEEEAAKEAFNTAYAASLPMDDDERTTFKEILSKGRNAQKAVAAAVAAEENSGSIAADDEQIALAASTADAATKTLSGLAWYLQGDYAPALRLWRPLAEQGHADAQFFLAGMYAEGRGVPQDDALAASWARKASDQGHAEAQAKLGAAILEGTWRAAEGRNRSRAPL